MSHRYLFRFPAALVLLLASAAAPAYDIAPADSCLGVNLTPLASLDPGGCNGIKPGDTKEGMYVNFVEPDSPADLAGLRRGDVIVSYNWTPSNTIEQMLESVRALVAGQEFAATVQREGEFVQITGRMGERDEESDCVVR